MKNEALKENIKLIGSMIIIGILLLYITFQLFIPDMTVRVFGFKPYGVLTQSMEPVIDRGDLVVVRQFELDDAEVGDIITFRTVLPETGTEEIVTHYIYSITETGGNTVIKTNRYFDEDDTPFADTWILTEDQVVGAYWFHIPYLGYITQFVRSPFGIAAVIVNIGVITAIVILIKKGKPEEQQKVEDTKEE
ncbi:signal peptidase I [Candidatus Xianfuyuplasma coldseepsis]|uniref:Signal peptidase I n=1 Tax=Candidatus Xianfuyuplasma coldseepsis TaxID=2782163 RepID=A0A7L7KQY1_9MOLU|nr:signal peptidase I [Xianfuyuplasma coldseepsis]QMS84626.1 signal peptidase I [Xianfuyuplasma coldseepsis]